MPSATAKGPLVSCLAAVAATALLVWFGTGLRPLWPLVWLAPLPALLVAPRVSWWRAALVAAAAWFLGDLNMWRYYSAVIHIPVAIVIEILAIPALVFAIAVVLFRALLKREAAWASALAVPAVWVSFEYLLSLGSPHGTAGSLAYTQLNFLPFLQLASLTGPWGMSFLLLLLPSALAVAWHLWPVRASSARHVLGASLGVVLAALAFGVVRLALPGSGQPVKVGLVASDGPNAPVADEGPATIKLLRDYAAAASALAAQGAEVVVLPEKLGVVGDRDKKASDILFQSLAERTGAAFAVGLIRVAPDARYNEARLYAPGTPVSRYEKQHMLPGFESQFRAGEGLTLLGHPSGTWGVAICKDMDFASPSRRYGQVGVGLLLVPAWDFVVDRFQHGHMAVMRGVESGFAVVRAAKQGYLTVSDDRGRILAETTSDSAPFAMLLATVPASHDATLYLLWGDWFAWAALGVLALVLMALVRRR